MLQILNKYIALVFNQKKFYMTILTGNLKQVGITKMVALADVKWKFLQGCFL